MMFHFYKIHFKLKQIYDLSGIMKIFSENNLKQHRNEFRNNRRIWYFSKRI